MWEDDENNEDDEEGDVKGSYWQLYGAIGTSLLGLVILGKIAIEWHRLYTERAALLVVPVGIIVCLYLAGKSAAVRMRYIRTPAFTFKGKINGLTAADMTDLHEAGHVAVGDYTGGEIIHAKRYLLGGGETKYYMSPTATLSDAVAFTVGGEVITNSTEGCSFDHQRRDWFLRTFAPPGERAKVRAKGYSTARVAIAQQQPLIREVVAALHATGKYVPRK